MLIDSKKPHSDLNTLPKLHLSYPNVTYMYCCTVVPLKELTFSV